MAAAAAPLVRPEVVCVARRLTTRLAATFKSTVPSARLLEERAPRGSTPTRGIASLTWVAPFCPIQTSPFQYRLPPPVL